MHCHPSQGLLPQALSRLLRDLEVTRDESGARETYDRLDEVLGELQREKKTQ